MDSRLHRGQFQYLIKWKGYTAKHNTWEPSANMENAKEARNKFHQRHPSAPRQMKKLTSKGIPMTQEMFLNLFKPCINHTNTPANQVLRLNIDEENDKHVRTGVLGLRFSLGRTLVQHHRSLSPARSRHMYLLISAPAAPEGPLTLSYYTRLVSCIK